MKFRVQEQLRCLRLEREPVLMHKVPIIPLETLEAENARVLTTPLFPLPVSSSSKLFSVIFPAHLLLGELTGCCRPSSAEPVGGK